MKNVLTTVTNKVKTSKLGLYASGALMGLASLAPVMADGIGGSVCNSSGKGMPCGRMLSRYLEPGA